VFHLARAISAIAYTNKELIYALLFDIAAETCARSPRSEATWAPASA